MTVLLRSSAVLLSSTMITAFHVSSSQPSVLSLSLASSMPYKEQARTSLGLLLEASRAHSASTAHRTSVRCDHRNHHHCFHEDHHHHEHQHHYDHHDIDVLKLSNPLSKVQLALAAFGTMILPILMRYLKMSRSIPSSLHLSTLVFLPKSFEIVSFVAAATLLRCENMIKGPLYSLVNRCQRIKAFISQHVTFNFRPKDFLLLQGNNLGEADKVTILGVWVNLILSIGKFFVGVSCHSAALVADAGHSLSDLFSDFITLFAVQMGRLPPDEDHPYGHGKFEALGSLFLALTLLMTGLSVGSNSIGQLKDVLSFSVQQSSSAAAASMLAHQSTSSVHLLPKRPALLMAAISVVSKEWLFRITHKVGKQINSPVVLANAWHHRSDAFSSIMALGSLALAIFVPGFLAADAAAGLFVAGMIGMTGVDILEESIHQLMDAATNDDDDDGEEQRVKELVLKTSDDVLQVQRVHSRQTGINSMVEVEIETHQGISTSAKKTIEDRVRSNIMKHMDNVSDVMVKASDGTVICPLLVAKQARMNAPLPVVENAKESLSSSEVAATTAMIGTESKKMFPAVADIEQRVRNLLVQKYGTHIESVQKVTVHFRDSILVHVELDVQFNSFTVQTLDDAHHWSSLIQETLESQDEIDSASVFLNLNSASSSPTIIESGRLHAQQQKQQQQQHWVGGANEDKRLVSQAPSSPLDLLPPPLVMATMNSLHRNMTEGLQEIRL